jgi:hypothetical protein
MTRRLTRTFAGALVVLAAQAAPSRAQRPAAPAAFPGTRADSLLAAGRWSEAENAFYAQARPRPREPIARAALGRYLAMKGALLPGTILIEEAQKFGLDPSVAQALLAEWRDVQRGRGALRFAVDSAITVDAPVESVALFRVPLPVRAGRRGENRPRVWADVVPRTIGLDTAAGRPRIGIETIEMLLPAFDVLTHQVTFHADPRSALSAIGHRYPVLRTADDVRVLVAPGRVLSLAPALRELDARWWQLDLPHGFVVVR